MDTGTCPYCGKVFEVDQYGRNLACPYCRRKIDVFPDNFPDCYISPGNENGRGEVTSILTERLLGDIEDARQFCRERIPGARKMLRELESRLADLQSSFS